MVAKFICTSNTQSNARHSKSRKSFIVGGRHTRGPGLSAGDRSLPRYLHHQWNQTPLIVQGGFESSVASLHHFGNDPHQRTILQGRGNPLLIGELLVDFISGTVCTFLNTYIHSES